MVVQKHTDSAAPSATLTIPELEQSEAAVLSTLASVHSRRSYAYAIERFIAWYCSEPRLTFNRTVVVRYRSYLEGLDLSASTINLHLSAIRRLRLAMGKAWAYSNHDRKRPSWMESSSVVRRFDRQGPHSACRALWDEKQPSLSHI